MYRTVNAIFKTPLLLSLAVIFAIAPAIVQAVAPPAEDVQAPKIVAQQALQMAKSYTNSGLARRIQQLKEEREESSKSGLSFSAIQSTFVVPVLVGNYSDKTHIFSSGQYDSVLFGANATGSMTDYYDEISYGAFTVTGDVYAGYTAANTQAYYVNGNYGMDGSYAYPANAAGFIKSLLGSADGSINFAQYDNDGPDGIPNSGDDDGYVDALIVVFPDGDASGGDSDNIWAHRWSLAGGSGTPFTTNDAANGGGMIAIDVYTIQGGEQGNGTVDQIKPIGVFCHEFGHVLGLPDLYDVDGSTRGIGRWGLMGAGSWGASGGISTEHQPVHMCAWSKAYLGWITPTVVTGTQAVNVPNVENNAVAYKLWDDAYQGARYFLFENRTRTGFDIGLPTDGVLIWHCNDEVFHSNADDAYRLVDLEEADGLNQIDNNTSSMDGGDQYPGSSLNTNFNDASNPSADDVFGSATGVIASGFTLGSGTSRNITFTQRPLDGYTINIKNNTWLSNYGFASSVVTYGARRFNSGIGGDLVAIQAGLADSNGIGYSVRIFNDMVAGTPIGLQSTTNGAFPQVYTARYHKIDLSSPLPLSANQTFVVDIGWGPDTYAVPFTSEDPISMESYFSADGVNYTTWTNKDVAIRALVRYSPLSAGDDESLLPDDFVLEQNYPNPFNPATEISYSLPERSHVRLDIFNLLGQRVATLVNTIQSPGNYTTSWNGTDESSDAVASGIYFYRLEASDNVDVKKMVLLK